MKSLLRWLIGIFIMLGTLLLSNCGSYGCRVTFGSSTCNGSGSGSSFGGGGNGGGGGGGGGGNNGNAAAFVFETFGNDGGLDEYELFPSTQALTLNPNVPFQSTNAGVLSMAMAGTNDVYQLNSTSGQIYGWTIGSNGTLTSVNGSPFAASYLITSPVVGQGAITNPAGTLLFVAVQVPNEIYVYQIGSGGVLSQASGSPFAMPSGFVPNNLATDGKGNYLYVNNVISPGDVSSEVAAFAIGSGSSLLTPVSGSPFSFPIWQMQGDASGNYMIGTEGRMSGDSHLHVFAIAQAASSTPGALSEVLGSPFATINVPEDVVVQPNTGGTLVYSFSVNVNNADNPIEGYNLNTSSGALTAISGSPFTFIGRDGQFDQTGQYFFAYDGLDSTLWVFNVASSGALSSQVASTGSFLEPWVASDIP